MKVFIILINELEDVKKIKIVFIYIGNHDCVNQIKCMRLNFIVIQVHCCVFFNFYLNVHFDLNVILCLLLLYQERMYQGYIYHARI